LRGECSCRPPIVCAPGAADAPGALAPAEFRSVMGYGDDDREAKLLIS